MTEFGQRPFPPAHASRHASGGADQVDVSGLTPKSHKTSHQNGGADELNVSGLTGGLSFVDRGDPDGPDFDLSDFTRDNVWRDLDLGGIVTAGAKLVLIHVYMRCDMISRNIAFRQNGNSGFFNAPFPSILDSLLAHGYDVFVAPDSNAKVEYKIDSGGTWVFLEVVICGWFI